MVTYRVSLLQNTFIYKPFQDLVDFTTCLFFLHIFYLQVLKVALTLLGPNIAEHSLPLVNLTKPKIDIKTRKRNIWCGIINQFLIPIYYILLSFVFIDNNPLYIIVIITFSVHIIIKVNIVIILYNNTLECCLYCILSKCSDETRKIHRRLHPTVAKLLKSYKIYAQLLRVKKKEKQIKREKE